MMRRLLLLVAVLLVSTSAFADQAIRLTLQQGVPVTDADIAGATSVCLEPYLSPRDQLMTYNGTSWVAMDVAASTYCLSTSGLSVNTNYDVLVTSSGGLPVLSWSVAWTDDTHPPARALQNGVDVSAVDHTNLVIGAVHVNSIGQLEDNHTHRWLSNYYRPEPRKMWAVDPAVTWNNSTSTGYTNATAYQQAHGNAANQLDYIAVVSRMVGAHVQAAVINLSGGGDFVGIGLDGNSLGDVSQSRMQASIPSSLGSVSFQTSADYLGTPGLGHHTVLWLEHIYYPPGTNPTWLGAIPPSQISGIFGVVMN